MLKGKTFLAVIPARGGSKRLVGKNILRLGEKPLIAWTIEAAKKSRYLDDVVVSSDNAEIIDVARRYGASVPFVRPMELATDEASSVDVVLHVLHVCREMGKTYDYVVLLQPTSPLRTQHHIDEAIELCLAKKAETIISVVKTEHSPLWMNVLPENGSMDNFLNEEIKKKRSQELPIYYRLNGAIYVRRIKTFELEQSFFPKKGCFAYEMLPQVSVDIDDIYDFEYAKALLNYVSSH